MALIRSFVAQHFLTGADFGKEGRSHSHSYRIEIQLSSTMLNNNGFVFDINELNDVLEELIGYFRDKTLNQLEEFEGLNPSLENFCRIFYEKLIKRFEAASFDNITVLLWEDSNAWASFTPGL